MRLSHCKGSYLVNYQASCHKSLRCVSCTQRRLLFSSSPHMNPVSLSHIDEQIWGLKLLKKEKQKSGNCANLPAPKSPPCMMFRKQDGEWSVSRFWGPISNPSSAIYQVCAPGMLFHISKTSVSSSPHIGYNDALATSWLCFKN